MVGDILQPTHLLFVLVIALLVLGPKRLPEVGRTLGSGMRDFRSAISGEENHERPARQEPETIYAPPEPPVASAVAEPEPAVARVAVEEAPAADDVPPPLSVAPAAADAPQPVASETTV